MRVSGWWGQSAIIAPYRARRTRVRAGAVVFRAAGTWIYRSQRQPQRAQRGGWGEPPRALIRASKHLESWHSCVIYSLA